MSEQEDVKIDPEREAMLEKFNQSREPEKVEAPKEEKTVTPPDDGDTATQAEKTEDVPPTEKGVREGEEKKPATPAEKMVPHAALHAEREKRKESEARARELEEQQKTLLADLQKLTESKPADQPIDDYEKAILDERKKRESLEKEVSALKADHQKRSEWEKAEETRNAQEVLAKRVSDSDASLAKSGFPGFSRFKSLVAEELSARVRDGEAVEDVDTPQEWERTYKEKVYPQVREMFVSQRLKEKEEKKKDANISTGSGGGTPRQEQKEKPWNIDDYMEMRRKRQSA